MFLEEARLAALLDHPNVVQTYDLGKEEGEFFFTMEFVYGENLQGLLKALRKVNQVLSIENVVTIGLGVAAGLFSSDDALAQDLLAAGEFSGDRAWRMPVWEEYQPSLKSPFADVANIGTGGAGSVLAACFLARFVEKQRWAHLDVAGTAFKGGTTKGATGRPVSLLFRYLVDQAGG